MTCCVYVNGTSPQTSWSPINHAAEALFTVLNQVLEQGPPFLGMVDALEKFKLMTLPSRHGIILT